MYLSKLILNPGNKRVQRELANIYELHRTLMTAFPNGIEKETHRILFRIDNDSNTGLPAILVQSLHEPQWLKLNVDDNYLFSSAEMKRVDLKFSKGQVLYFKLYANPTVKRNGKRIGLIKEEEQAKWLERKASAGGFTIVQSTIIPKGIVKQKKAKMDISLLAVVFEGHMRVDDPVKFIKTIEKGIGSGKGLGFGLLSVAPYRN